MCSSSAGRYVPRVDNVDHGVSRRARGESRSGMGRALPPALYIGDIVHCVEWLVKLTDTKYKVAVGQVSVLTGLT